MAAEEKKIYVYENWSSEIPRELGILYVSNVRGTETFSFEYNEEYLKNPVSCSIDPDLELFQGRQFTYQKPNFGIFSDSAPDRWGRTLMDRRERFRAKEEGRKPRTLLTSDYLLGVYDESRMGALRFALEKGGQFLSSDSEESVPPWTTLRTLEEASREFEKDENSLSDKWLSQLLKPGSSLGGARPKATVRDVDGSLWIAKFPSKHDESNVGSWEKVVHDLAKICGLNVPESRLETFSRHGGTFIVKRFDRIGNRRIHFSSAMTMLGKVDGASAHDGTSYLEIADFIIKNGAKPKGDLTELWKRIVFNMAVSNTDDHLRNHGFILSKNGWRLSPAYDMNPNPAGEGLALNVSENDNSIDINLALSTHKFYQLEKDEAEKIASEICLAVSRNWEKTASKQGISRSMIELMRPAFVK
ncbi:type II toxin-antitoxin system HipA family toxin [bacterium]|nr:type II toxin-antitoxin system HipA family toxin [bacterium]